MKSYLEWKTNLLSSPSSSSAWYHWHCNGTDIPIKCGRMLLGQGSDGRTYIEVAGGGFAVGVPLDECTLVPQEKWAEYDKKYLR